MKEILTWNGQLDFIPTEQQQLLQLKDDNLQNACFFWK